MVARRLEPFGTSIFSSITALAQQQGAINLAQGFPDFEGEPWMLEGAVAALRSGENQYVRSQGHPRLVRAVADRVGRDHGLAIDPLTQVAVTCGATEGLAAASLGLLEPGDEVLVLEPCYDSYAPVLAMAGALPRCVPLRFPDFRLEPEALRAALTPRCRALLLNSPHNPTGRVLDEAELELLAGVCRERDLIAITDEVYEHLCYGSARHRPLATLPGMAERTLTLSSAGKTLAFTGWKVGWAWGPAPLVAGLQAAHQFLTFCAAAPLQVAVALALEGLDEARLAALRAAYETRRQLLCQGLTDLGWQVAWPEGSYFCMAGYERWTADDDHSVVELLIRRLGVAAIPPSVFYPQHPEWGRGRLRFAFCKRVETLRAALERLGAAERELGWAP